MTPTLATERTSSIPRREASKVFRRDPYTVSVVSSPGGDADWAVGLFGCLNKAR